MYQGKFDAKRKKASVDAQELVAQRNAAPKKKEAPVKASADEELLTRKKAAAQKEAPAAEEAPVKKKAPAAEAPAKKSAPKKDVPAAEEAPVKKKSKKEAPAVEETPKRRGPRVGGVIFYTFYFMFILLFFVAVFFALQWVQDWLVDYEAAQPTAKCTQVFEQLFTDPDWDALYDAAAIEDTPYEGKEAFVAYMEDKVGNTKLTYMETSAGLSGDKKYIVKLGEEKIASFTLVDKAKSDSALAEITDLPQWELGSIELFYERTESYRIQKLDDHTVYVNDVALDDSYTIQKATTAAEKYLPDGITGVWMCTQEITGLMSTPTVTIFDDKGQQMEVTYDEATRTFTERTEANTISEDEETVALNAAKAYALYMIEKASRAQVAKYFDTSSDIYSIIVKSDVWTVQDNNGYEFADETVSDYCRYADDLFSARVSMKLNVTRKDGTIKEFTVDSTLFFELQSTGKWLAYEMTNVDVQAPVGQVRLTFMNGDTVLSSDFYNTNITQLTTPVVSVPEGKVFTGWVREDVAEDGTTTLTVVFSPDETGYVPIPSGTTLEPMTLYALFEDAPTAATEGA